MQLNIPPDLEKLINKRISSGAYMTFCAAPSKRRTPRKAGLTRNAAMMTLQECSLVWSCTESAPEPF
jgi:hypothetical protein